MEQSRRRRIVLLDDEPAILRAWSAILEVHDFEAVCCETAAQAMAALADGCDCFITDYHMQDMTGIEILRLVRERVTVPTMLMTADDTPSIRAAALAAGATEIIGKPAPILKVVARIQELCSE